MSISSDGFCTAYTTAPFSSKCDRSTASSSIELTLFTYHPEKEALP